MSSPFITPWSPAPPVTGWWPLYDAILAAVIGESVTITPGHFHYAGTLAEAISETNSRTMAFTYHGTLAEAITETASIAPHLNRYGFDTLTSSITDTITAALAKTRYLALTSSITDTITSGLTLSSAPTFDSSASGFGSGSSPVNFTWTDIAEANAYGIVAVFGGNSMTTAAAASVTWGATTLSSLGSVYLNNTSAEGFAWVFGAPNVPSGSQTISVTLTQPGESFAGFAYSFSYLNVSSVGALQTAFGNSTSPSLTVSSAPNNTVWGAAVALATISSFSLTTRQGTASVVAGDAVGVSSATVSGSITSAPWAVVGLELISNIKVSVSQSITDAITTTLGKTRHLALPLSITDAVTSAFKYAGVLAVSRSITDTVTSGLNAQFRSGVSKSITDTVTPGLSHGQHLAASVSITDTVTAAIAVTVPVSFVSAGAGQAVSTGSSVTTKTVTWSETIGAGANETVVIVGALTAGTYVSATAQVGSTGMTLSEHLVIAGGPFPYNILVFTLSSPPTGAQTISVTVNQTSSAILSISAESASYSGVSSLGTIATNTGSGTSATLSVSSVSGEMVVQAFYAQTALSAYSQTQRFATTAFIMGDAAGASSVSFAATLASTGVWGAVGIPLL